MYIIFCRDCGGPRVATKSNTRYCHVCRALRDGLYWQMSQRKRECTSCKASFLPLFTADCVCSSCHYVLPEHRNTCALCSTPDQPLVRAGISVCVRCAQDPARRPLLMSALEKKREERRERYNHLIGRELEPYNRELMDELEETTPCPTPSS